jgi:hypothetical protein
MRGAAVLALLCGLLAGAHPLRAEETENAPRAELRVLDKITGRVEDLALSVGETRNVGALQVTLGECRYPAANPAGDAYVELTIRDSRVPAPVFEGWMIASAPALSALDHPRYDVWALRCITS